ncbi:MAG TPA: folate-binding protein YgfZ [Rhodobacteraceae bacterium]|nr:folate-binding protein YgfZ [Paracoccaceae bacterium]
MGETHAGRTILRITGADRESFLQGLVTNDVRGLDTISYGALLTPQGKFIADFFLVPEAEAILLDVAEDLSAELLKKLNMYKLRAEVAIEKSDLYAIRGVTSPAPEGAWEDPRHPALGWRLYSATPGDAPSIDWDMIRVTHAIPEVGRELTPETYILEAGFERLNGVDFRKGCYVGQEVTARMKHKTELRKGFVGVTLDGPAPAAGAKVTTEDGKEVGELTTVVPGRAIAYLRFDRAKGPLLAGNTRVIRDA